MTVHTVNISSPIDLFRQVIPAKMLGPKGCIDILSLSSIVNNIQEIAAQQSDKYKITSQVVLEALQGVSQAEKNREVMTVRKIYLLVLEGFRLPGGKRQEVLQAAMKAVRMWFGFNFLSWTEQEKILSISRVPMFWPIRLFDRLWYFFSPIRRLYQESFVNRLANCLDACCCCNCRKKKEASSVSSASFGSQDAQDEIDALLGWELRNVHQIEQIDQLSKKQSSKFEAKKKLFEKMVHELKPLSSKAPTAHTLKSAYRYWLNEEYKNLQQKQTLPISSDSCSTVFSSSKKQ